MIYKNNVAVEKGAIYARYVTRTLYATLDFIEDRSEYASIFRCGLYSEFTNHGLPKGCPPLLFYEVALVDGGSWWSPVTTTKSLSATRGVFLKLAWGEYWSDLKAWGDVQAKGLARPSLTYLWISGLSEAGDLTEFNGGILEGFDCPFPRVPPPEDTFS